MLTRLHAHWPAFIIGIFATGLYASTLMVGIGNCLPGYCGDTGEFQVALALWGTAHYTGYPLYLLLGSPWVTLARWVGISPAASGSLYSLMWQVLAMVGSVYLLQKLTGNKWLALSAGGLLTVLEPIWLHGSITEVYSLSLALSVAMLALTLDLHDTWSDRKGWGLVLLAGLGVAHHRLLALLVPPISLYLWNTARRHSPNFGRWLMWALPVFLAGFLPYLDMPVRMWRGTPWHYGRPDTWAGFWDIFTGREVSALQKPDFTLMAIWSAAQDSLATLQGEFTLPGMFTLGLGIVGALWASATRTITWLFIGLLAFHLGFILVLRQAVFLKVAMMVPLLIFVLGMSLGLSRLPPRWATLAGVGLLGWAGWLCVRNYAAISALTDTRASVALVERFEQLEAPPGSVVMLSWGQPFFALAYAQLVDGHFSQWTVVDHRANFAELAPAQGGRIYTAQETLFDFGLDRWREQLGSPLRLTSAGPGLLAVSPEPLPPPQAMGYPLASGMALVDWEVRPSINNDQLSVTLYWVATTLPTVNYSTFVHVTDQTAIVTLEDLIAQSDSSSPVYGWYPTTDWQANEVVREDHLLQLPPDRVARTLIVGMYSRDEAGNFVRLGQVTLRERAGAWIADPP